MGIFDRFNKKSKNENKENTLKKGNVVSENNEKYKSLYENYIQYATEIKDKYEKARIKVDGEILSGRINEKGYSVIEYTTTGSKTILGVYDNKGNLEYNVKLSNNIIGEYVLSNNLKYIAYVDVNIKGISVSTNVVLVELKNNNVKTIYSSEASLVYDLKFNGNNLLYKLDDQVVYHNLSNDKKVTSTLENDSIVNIDVDDKKYAYTEFNNGKYFLGIRSIGGKETKEIEIREMPKHFK